MVLDCASHNADFDKAQEFDFAQAQSPGSIPVVRGIWIASLESLQKPAFPFASSRALK
jgi:hypothetical protein